MAEWGVWRVEGAGQTHEVVLRLQRMSGLVQLWVDGAPREARTISYSFDHDLTLGARHAKVSVLYGRGPTLRFELDGQRLPPAQTKAPSNAAALLANAPTPPPPAYPVPTWQDQVASLLPFFAIQVAPPIDTVIAFTLGGLTALLATKVLDLKGHPLVPALSVSWGYHGWLVVTALMVHGAWPLFLIGAVGLWLFTWLLPAPKALWQVAAVLLWSCLGTGLFVVVLDTDDRGARKLVAFSAFTTVALAFLLIRGVQKLRAPAHP